MNKFTPGPWEAVKCPCGHKSCKSWMVNPIVMLQGAIYDEADARLIAAAPEMYEALKELVDQCALSTPLWDKASAILAKVEK